MAAPTDYYVDPSIASDGGLGTLGSPWTRADGQCVQYALNNITRDTTNGDRINIKAGSRDIVPTSGYTLTTYGTPAINAQLYFQGYTSAQGDGGIGLIDVDGNTMWASTGYSYINLAYLDVTDLNATKYTGTDLCHLDNNNYIYNCTFHGLTPGLRVVELGSDSHAMWNYFYNNTATQIRTNARTHIIGNKCITGPTYDFDFEGLRAVGIQTVFMFNIVSVNGDENGIRYFYSNTVMHNSVYSDGGTGTGIFNADDAVAGAVVLNNLVEGFSGTGGVGIATPANEPVAMIAGNAVYDCATAYDINDVFMYETDNETLSASPFNDAANADFTPVDTGNVKEGAKPGKIGIF